MHVPWMEMEMLNVGVATIIPNWYLPVLFQVLMQEPFIPVAFVPLEVFNVGVPTPTINPLLLVNSVSVSAGGNFSCALDDSLSDLLGYNGNNLITFTPNTVFTQIASGGSHVCGIKTNRGIECWGAFGQGQSNPPTHTDFIS